MAEAGSSQKRLEERTQLISLIGKGEVKLRTSRMESPRKSYQLHHFSHFTWKSLSKRSQADFESQRRGSGRSERGLSRRDKFVQSRSNWRSAIRSFVAYLIALTRHETKRIQCCRDVQFDSNYRFLCSSRNLLGEIIMNLLQSERGGGGGEKQTKTRIEGAADTATLLRSNSS